MSSGERVTRERDEAQLLAALRRGEESAFRELVQLHDAGLRRMARLYVDDAAAEDVVQETWAVVVHGLDRFEGRSALRTWVYGILVNVARRRGEREGRTIPFAAAGSGSDAYGGAADPERLHHPELGHGYWAASPVWARDPHSGAIAGEIRSVLKGALEAMTPAQREVMTLRDIEGWSAAEVSAVLGISEVNQRTLLHRARVKARRALEEYLDG